MNLLILGGYSIYNKDWVEEVRKTFSDLFESIEILPYKHWATGDETVDIRPEVENIKELVEGKKDVVIIGKSAGASLALQAIHNGDLKPIKCVFVGMAFQWSVENGFDMRNLLRDFSTPTLFLQQTKDAATKSDDLKKLITRAGVKNYEFVEFEGSDHAYSEMSQIREAVEAFIKK